MDHDRFWNRCHLTFSKLLKSRSSWEASKIESGVYTQIRFQVSKATVIADGQEHDAVLHSGKLRLTRPFRVETGQTTVVQTGL